MTKSHLLPLIDNKVALLSGVFCVVETSHEEKKAVAFHPANFLFVVDCHKENEKSEIDVFSLSLCGKKMKNGFFSPRRRFFSSQRIFRERMKF